MPPKLFACGSHAAEYIAIRLGPVRRELAEEDLKLAVPRDEKTVCSRAKRRVVMLR